MFCLFVLVVTELEDFFCVSFREDIDKRKKRSLETCLVGALGADFVLIQSQR